MAEFWPCANCSSAAWRSARLTALWWTKTSTPRPAMAPATRSASLLLSTNTRLFVPWANRAASAATPAVPSRKLRYTSRCAGGAGRVYPSVGPLARAGEPLADGVRIAHRRRQPDALHVTPAEAHQPLEDAHQVRPAVIRGERVHLVDDDSGQPAEESPRVRLLADEHHLERLGGNHQHVCRLTQEPCARRRGDVSVPLERVQPDHARVPLRPRLLVVQQGVDGAHVECRHRCQVLGEDAREHREEARLRLATRRRSEHHGVAPVEDGLGRELLDRTEPTPPQLVGDRVSQPRVQPEVCAAPAHAFGSASAHCSLAMTRKGGKMMTGAASWAHACWT
jgi:hypothetical protein